MLPSSFSPNLTFTKITLSASCLSRQNPFATNLSLNRAFTLNSHDTILNHSSPLSCRVFPRASEDEEVSAEFAMNITFNRERIQKSLPAGFPGATTLADYLVKKVTYAWKELA